MSRGVNKVILVGRLGADPDVRQTPSGLTVARLNLATNSSSKNQQTGQWEETTEWHRVVLFERLADVASNYLKKGRQIYIEGRLKTNKWQDQNGQDRYTTEIIAYEMQMLGGRDDMATDNTAPYYSQPAAPPPQQQQPQQPGYTPPSPQPDYNTSPPPPTPASSKVSEGKDNFDEDVPF